MTIDYRGEQYKSPRQSSRRDEKETRHDKHFPLRRRPVLCCRSHGGRFHSSARGHRRRHPRRVVVTNQDVITAEGRIAAIAATDPRRPGTHVVELAGKYVVPGYLDMHAHPLGDGDRTGTLRLMLARGITGFRQMSGSSKLLKQRRAGTLPIPVESPDMLQMPGAVLTPLNAGSAKAAVTTVREQHAAGADFIKVGLVSPTVFFAAQQEANSLGIPILGHLPVGIDVAEASARGMKSIEHLGPGSGSWRAAPPRKPPCSGC